MTELNVLEVITEAALAAGEEAAKLLVKPEVYKDKGEGDFSTTADIRSQEIIVESLRREFPDIPIIAEEDDPKTAVPAECFVIDPLDGTIIAARGWPNWGVTIGYLQEHKPRAGVICMPCRGMLIQAEKGRGVYLTDLRSGTNRRIYSPACGDAKQQLVICTDYHYASTAEGLERYLLPFIKAGALQMHLGLGSAVAGAVAVLLGRADLYLNAGGPKVWDFAAAVVALEEVGGVAAAVDGSPLDFSKVPMTARLCRDAAIADRVRTVLDI